MASVGTSIIGRPRRLSRHRRAASSYTLICEEPDYVASSYWLLSELAIQDCGAVSDDNHFHAVVRERAYGILYRACACTYHSMLTRRQQTHRASSTRACLINFPAGF
jgi:hypothetical protein